MARSLHRFLVQYVIMLENGNQMHDAISVERDGPLSSPEEVMAMEAMIHTELDGRTTSTGDKMFPVPFMIRVLTWVQYSEQLIVVPGTNVKGMIQ